MVLRTDLSIVQLPTSIPDFSAGKNVTQTDPDFGSKILRFTDENDNPNSPLMTADGGSAGLWNTDDTMLLCRNAGGVSLLYQFDPKTFTRKPLIIGRYSGKNCFSSRSNNVLYNLNKSVVTKVVFTKVLGLWKEKSRAVVVDFVKVLPLGFHINWVGTFEVSMQDQTFVVGFSEGVQNSAFLCCVWQKGFRKGFRVLNTQTGTVSGDWGERGPIRMVSLDTAVPFTMHECSATPNPDYAAVGAYGGHGSPIIWHIPTLDLVDSIVAGHRAKGYMHAYAGGPGGGQIKEVAYADPSQTRMIVPKEDLPANQVPPQKYDGDSHFGFGMVAQDDDSIFWVSSQSFVASGEVGKEFTSCWMNEVRGYHAWTGVVERACHTFNSGTQEYFIAKYAIAVPSQTGKYVAFCSDMMGTLKDKRSDVFIVQVQ